MSLQRLKRNRIQGEVWRDYFFAYKIAGAKAEEGADLLSVKKIAEIVVANTRLMGVALSPCIVPEAGKPTFSIGENEMEIGVGIHGERGLQRGELQTADQITESLVTKIVEDLPFKNGDRLAVMVNSLGATPKEELFIMY
jgi:dihydroxyacetone kinase